MVDFTGRARWRGGAGGLGPLGGGKSASFTPPAKKMGKKDLGEPEFGLGAHSTEWWRPAASPRASPRASRAGRVAQPAGQPDSGDVPARFPDGHCAVRKSVIYIYSIYISAPPSNRPLEHLFVVQPSYARPTHAHVRIGVWYHPHGACRGFWLSIFGTRLFWPSLQCAPKPMKLVHRCHLRGWFRG